VRILATHVLQAAKLNFADIAQAVFGLLALLSIPHWLTSPQKITYIVVTRSPTYLKILCLLL